MTSMGCDVDGNVCSFCLVCVTIYEKLNSFMCKIVQCILVQFVLQTIFFSILNTLLSDKIFNEPYHKHGR